MVAEGLKYQCVIPLVSRDRVVGILAINRRTDNFTPDEISFLKEASGQIAIAKDFAGPIATVPPNFSQSQPVRAGGVPRAPLFAMEL